MKNIRMMVEYDGTSFAGWQRQACSKLTVQGVIEAALARILQEKITLAAAGRTDKGVHARAQVANFVTCSSLEPARIVHSLNSLLPRTIRASNPLEVPPDFHARHSAKERHYRYFLLEKPSAIQGRFAGCSFGEVDMEIMRQMALLTVGTHDFSAFSKEDRDNPASHCTVKSCDWYRDRDLLVLHISANRFLRSMVRYLVDAMVRGGKGLLGVDTFGGMVETGVVSGQLNPASPAGLFLWEVSY